MDETMVSYVTGGDVVCLHAPWSNGSFTYNNDNAFSY